MSEKCLQIVLSTRNPIKAEQIKAVFEESIGNKLIQVFTLAEAGIEGQAEEDNFPSATLSANALKKARFARERLKPEIWAMADDTGLFIDGLSGEPGVMAGTWAGKRATTEEIMRHTLDRTWQLKDPKDRRATLETIIALIGPDGTEHSFSGQVKGVLLYKPRGFPQPKMPYSALFVPDGAQKVWVEMTLAEENAISHRGLAVRVALEFLKTFL